jgi:tRNA (guanine-N7-)-methyltransferase
LFAFVALALALLVNVLILFVMLCSTVRFVDVGCGFGGLTIALATLFPDKLVIGLEIRAKLVEYVRLRIDAFRVQSPGSYQNAACLRTNCQRYLPNFFRKGQLEKIFFCFPDPHFKAKNHRRRIISDLMLDEYAYVLAPGCRLYCITDVEELHIWQVAKCSAHAAFERIEGDEELKATDPCVEAMLEETEEGKKVTRMNGNKYFAVFRRREDSEMTPSWVSKLTVAE